MTDTPRPLIVGLCGSTIAGRREALLALRELESKALNITIPPNVRATWRRGEALDDAIDAAGHDHPLLLAKITCLEEAEAVESYGGHVVHVDGLPSDDIAIKRDSLLMTVSGVARGRYTTPEQTFEALKARM